MEETRRGVGGALAQRGVAGRGSWASGGDADEERESSSPEGKRGRETADDDGGGWRPAGLDWTGLAWIGLDGTAWDSMGWHGIGLLGTNQKHGQTAREREHGERCEHGGPLSFDALVPVLSYHRSQSPEAMNAGDEKQKKKTSASCMPTVTAYLSTCLPSYDTQPSTRPARLMQLQQQQQQSVHPRTHPCTHLLPTARTPRPLGPSPALQPPFRNPQPRLPNAFVLDCRC
jgi:hypothetical protein